MPYRSPSPTFGEVKRTLSSGYGVVFTLRTIAPGTPGRFTAVHCKRLVGDKEYESMLKNRPDDIPMSWYELNSMCRNLNIDPDNDKLFGVI